MTEQQITNEILTADLEFVGQYKPGSNNKSFISYQICYRLSLIGTYLEVILYHDRLAVEVICAVFGITLKYIDCCIHHPDEHLTVTLKRIPPFSVPVSVGDNVVNFLCVHLLLRGYAIVLNKTSMGQGAWGMGYVSCIG